MRHNASVCWCVQKQFETWPRSLLLLPEPWAAALSVMLDIAESEEKSVVCGTLFAFKPQHALDPNGL